MRGTVAKKLRQQVFKDQATHTHEKVTERRVVHTDKGPRAFLFQWFSRVVANPELRRAYQQAKKDHYRGP
jgi:hypothetical protein